MPHLKGAPRARELFVRSPVPEAQATCPLGGDARWPGSSNRRQGVAWGLRACSRMGSEVGGLGGPGACGQKPKRKWWAGTPSSRGVGWGPRPLGCPPPGWLGLQVLAVLETGLCGQAHGVAAWSQGPWRSPHDVLLGPQAPSCARFVPLGLCPGLVPRPTLGSPWGVARASGSDF